MSSICPDVRKDLPIRRRDRVGCRHLPPRNVGCDRRGWSRPSAGNSTGWSRGCVHQPIDR